MFITFLVDKAIKCTMCMQDIWSLVLKEWLRYLHNIDMSEKLVLCTVLTLQRFIEVINKISQKCSPHDRQSIMLIYAQRIVIRAWPCPAATSDWNTASWDGRKRLASNHRDCSNSLLELLEPPETPTRDQRSCHPELSNTQLKLCDSCKESQNVFCASQTQTLRGTSSASHCVTKQPPTWSSIRSATPIHHECFPKKRHPRNDRQPTRSAVIPWDKPSTKTNLPVPKCK